MKSGRIFVVGCFLWFMLVASSAWAINGGTLRVTPRNGWKAFEVISYNDNPAGDGFAYAVPDTFDGVGAWLPNSSTLRLQFNHENVDASVSEVDLDLANYIQAIRNVITGGTTGGVTFVNSAQQAYGRWTANGGTNWTTTSDTTTTSFYRFCSSQFHSAEAFGPGRGFADNIYITGEEGSTNRLFANDVANRDFYQLSGVTSVPSPAIGGIGGMPFDAYENAALVDTGDTTHVALLLSPDGNTNTMRLYIGVKGKEGTDGHASNSFLARNGLAYGSYYYLNGTFPATPASAATTGSFSTSAVGALTIAKLEDVDTNPNNGNQVVQGIQETGLFMYDFSLVLSGDGLAPASSFTLKKLQTHTNDTNGSFGDPDNVDWTKATTLNGVNYPNGLIFVNEDSGTGDGETWMTTPVAGAAVSLIGDTIGLPSTETSGVLDISTLVGFRPGSILLTANQGGAVSSLTTLINPNRTLLGDFNGDGIVDSADYAEWRKGLGTIYTQAEYEVWRSQFGQTPGAGAGALQTTVPEPGAVGLVLVAVVGCLMRRIRG